MALDLIYITNNTAVALVAEKYGVDYIMIDLETVGKEERQKGMNTVKSHHVVEDVLKVSSVLSTSKTLVRVNPWNDDSNVEIESVISSGADIVMLPMWKTCREVDSFLRTVGGRTRTMLLLETKEAVEIIEQVLEHPLIDEIHIGLNDLHLSYGLTFMFELLTNGVVEYVCKACNAKGVKYGFGGIARLGEGDLPAEQIVMEHYRLGSRRAILSRSFCNTSQNNDISVIDGIFRDNVLRIREYEKSLLTVSNDVFINNKKSVNERVKHIVKRIQESKTV